MDSSCADPRLTELQLIASMFPGQLRFFVEALEHRVASDDLFAGDPLPLPEGEPIEFVFKYDEAQIEIHFSLPPEEWVVGAHVRLLSNSLSSSQSKILQLKINQQLVEFLEKSDGQPAVLKVIKWVQHFWESEEEVNHRVPVEVEMGPRSEGRREDSGDPDEDVGEQGRKRSRLWIYTHHIYSTEKRKFILEQATELGLSGFSRPGKPGFVCVEGRRDDCDEFWHKVKYLNWQRIQIIEKELFDEVEHQNEGQEEKKGSIFTGFEELSCQNAAFIRFLEQKKCSQIITSYLGF